MMYSWMSRAAAGVAMATLMLVQPAVAADLPESPKLLPPVVFAYATVPSTAEFKTRFDKSAIGELLRDPKLQPTFKQFQEAMKKGEAELQKNVGLSLKDLAAIPSGTITGAVCQLGEPGELGLVMMLDYGDSDDALDKLLVKAEENIDKNGGKRIVEQVEGTEVIIYEIKAAAPNNDSLEADDDEQAPKAPTRIAYFRKDQRLVISNGVPMLEAVLARWDGKHSSTFDGDEMRQYIAEKTKTDGREPGLSWFLNPLGAVQAGLSNAKNAPPQAQFVMAFLPTIGLTKFKAMGGSYDMATKEFDTIGKTFLYIEQPITGALGLFKFPQADLTPPKWISSAATGYFSANWDLAGAWATARNLNDLIRGPGSFDQMIDQVSQAGPKIHIKKDVIDVLTGRMHVLSFPLPDSAFSGESVPQQPTVIALGVKDEAKASALLTRLSKTPNFPGQSRQFQGVTIYDLPVGSGNMANLAIANGNLFFSTDTERMENLLRKTTGEALSTTAQYSLVAGHFPAEVSMLAYQHQRDQLRGPYEMFRTGKTGAELPTGAGEFDPSTLPPFEDIEQYLLPSGGYGIPDANGALLVNFSVRGK